MKYLHIMHNDKFNKAYIEFIEKEFNMKEHYFVFIGGVEEKKIQIPDKENILKIRSKKDLGKFVKVICLTNKYQKLYLHGLFNRTVIVMLYLQPWLLKKSNWILWGGDLYSYSVPKIVLKAKILEKMKSNVIKNMGYILTQVKGDYKLAQEIYKTKAKRYYTFSYLSNVFEVKDVKYKNSISSNGKMYIQVGNSGDPRNYHYEVFYKLKKYREENIEIVCPLAYGDKEYIKEVCEIGNSIFGDKFKPILELIPYEEYLNILSKINIAIFNHDRQQALGNTTQLLGLGKKVYIRNDVTTWEFAKEHNLKVYPTNEINDELFEVDEKSLNRNIDNIKKQFSREKLKQDWELIFNN